MIETIDAVDMSSQAVSSRLRVACKPSLELRRRRLVAMDASSVSARLRSVSEMGTLCQMMARRVVPQRTRLAG